MVVLVVCLCVFDHYHYFRLNPISAFFLNSENQGIKSLLKEVNNIQLETTLDMGCGRGNSLLLMPKSVINVIALDYCKEIVKRTKKNYRNVKFLQADISKFPFKKMIMQLRLIILKE